MSNFSSVHRPLLLTCQTCILQGFGKVTYSEGGGGKDIKCEINIDPVVWVHFRCRVATQKYDTSCRTMRMFCGSCSCIHYQVHRKYHSIVLRTSTSHSASGDETDEMCCCHRSLETRSPSETNTRPAGLGYSLPPKPKSFICRVHKSPLLVPIPVSDESSATFFLNSLFCLK
jgi:hypothetical protein